MRIPMIISFFSDLFLLGKLLKHLYPVFFSIFSFKLSCWSLSESILLKTFTFEYGNFSLIILPIVFSCSLFKPWETVSPLFYHIFHTSDFSPLLLHIWKFLWLEIPYHQRDLKHERFINLLAHCFFIMRITFIISNNIFWLSFLLTLKSSLTANQFVLYFKLPFSPCIKYFF